MRNRRRHRNPEVQAVQDEIDRLRHELDPKLTEIPRMILCRSPEEAEEDERQWIEAGRPGRPRTYVSWEGYPTDQPGYFARDHGGPRLLPAPPLALPAPAQPLAEIEAPSQPAGSPSAPRASPESPGGHVERIDPRDRLPRVRFKFTDRVLPAIGDIPSE